MQLPALLISDLHLTANPRDEYRWGIFNFVEDLCRTEELETLCILGDLTDAKDYHPSALTNRLVSEMMRMTVVCELRVIILMGYHDYLRTGHAYFDFLNKFPNITFVTSIWEDLSDGVAGLWLPHTKTPTKDWAELDTTHYQYVFMHQTVTGAVASNGMKMEGEGVPDLSAWCKVYSGDIHVPQTIRSVEYVGSPYHVHFGDKFKPRCVLLDHRNRAVDMYFPCIRKMAITVSSLRQLQRHEFLPGDQVKLKVELPASDKHEWSKIRKAAAEYLKTQNVELIGCHLQIGASDTRLHRAVQNVAVLSDEELVLQFVQAQDLGGDVLDTGLDVVR
jgi:hypothetical protein